MNDLQQIFENAKNDPSLLSKIDIQQLLNSLEHKNNDYLENKSLNDIHQEIYNLFLHLRSEAGDINRKLDLTMIKDFCQKLAEYRYVDEICEIHKGKHVRWMRINTTDSFVLTNGGIVVDIKFLENGTHVLCKNNANRFIQYKFDDCFTFQKLSLEEQLILMSYNYVK
jgi:hypothetical protein